MSLRVMSFNVRFDNPQEAPEDQWALRLPVCAEIILKYQPKLVGLQEPFRHQVEQLAELMPGYSWFGRGRQLAFMGINETHNELNPIFFDADVLTLEASGQFWYSDTPEIPNTKWACSAFPRIAVWGRFSINGTAKRVCFVNTHFDHESEEARSMAAEMLLAKIQEVSLGLPTVVVGDLNTGEGSPAHAMLAAAMREASSCCEECVIEGCLGKVGTFVGFDKSIDSQIDFIFGVQGANPTAFGTVPDERPDGRCCSDHRPIVADLDVPDCPLSEEEYSQRAAAQAAATSSATSAAASLAADKTRAVASRVAAEGSVVASKVAAETSVYASRAAVEAKQVAAKVGEKTSVYASHAASVVKERGSVYANQAAEEAKKAAGVVAEKGAVVAQQVADQASVVAHQAGEKAKAAAVELGGKFKKLFG